MDGFEDNPTGGPVTDARNDGASTESRPAHQKGRLKSRRHLDLARRRQMTYLQKRREQKRRRMFFSRIRAVIRLVFSVVLIAGLWALATASFWDLDSARFTVMGSGFISQQQLMPVIRKYQGTPIYEIDPQEISATLRKRYAILDEVYVRRRLFPARLELTMAEKRPWARVYQTAEATAPYALLGEDYGVIPLAPYQPDAVAEKTSKLPKIILPTGGSKPDYLRKLDILVYQLQSISGLHFQSLDASQPDQIVAHFQEISVRIGRLNFDVTQRLSRLITLVPKIQELQGRIDWVDLRWGKEITIHQIPEAELKAREEARLKAEVAKQAELLKQLTTPKPAPTHSVSTGETPIQ